MVVSSAAALMNKNTIATGKRESKCCGRFRHLQFQAPPKSRYLAPSAILQTKAFVVIPVAPR